MIVPTTNKTSENKEPEEEHLDPPPSYHASGSGSAVLAATTTTTLQPLNHISVVRKYDSIKGTFVIDPTMILHPSLLPPLEDGELETDRKNINLESHHGSVKADVILVANDSGKTTSQRTTVNLRSQHGAVVISLHAPSERPAIQLTAESKNGSVAVYLPRSFRGFLTLYTKHGSIVFSDSVSTHVTTFSHVESTSRCFIGEVAGALGEDVKEWLGDEVIAKSCHGKVKISFVDEAKPTKTGPAARFLSRVLGL